MKLFDPFRKKWVVETPEEKIRQALLKKMTKELGFFKNLISVETELSFLPSATKAPKRRLDILVYVKETKDSSSLSPLLLIECKAISLSNKALQQVMGYNHFVGAYFMGLCNEEEFVLFWKDKKGVLQKAPYLPTFNELLNSVSKVF